MKNNNALFGTLILLIFVMQSCICDDVEKDVAIIDITDPASIGNDAGDIMGQYKHWFLGLNTHHLTIRVSKKPDSSPSVRFLAQCFDKSNDITLQNCGPVFVNDIEFEYKDGHYRFPLDDNQKMDFFNAQIRNQKSTIRFTNKDGDLRSVEMDAVEPVELYNLDGHKIEKSGLYRFDRDEFNIDINPDKANEDGLMLIISHLGQYENMTVEELKNVDPSQRIRRALFVEDGKEILNIPKSLFKDLGDGAIVNVFVYRGIFKQSDIEDYKMSIISEFSFGAIL